METLERNRCSVCHGDLSHVVLQMALFQSPTLGIVMEFVPVQLLPGEDKRYDERIAKAVAIVDKPGCLRAFLFKWAHAQDGKPN